MCNVLCHNAVLEIPLRMKHAQACPAVHVMEFERSLSILGLCGIRIRQCRLGPVALVTPGLHPCIELIHSLNIIDGRHNRILFGRIIVNITKAGIQILVSDCSGIHKCKLRTTGIHIQRLHFRMILQNKVAELFNFIKGIDRVCDACLCCNITAVNGTIGGVGRQQSRNCVQMTIDGRLGKRRLRLHCIVLRCILRKQIIQGLEGTLSCQVAEVQPACAVCHIKGLSGGIQHRVLLCVLRPADPVDLQCAVELFLQKLIQILINNILSCGTVADNIHHQLHLFGCVCGPRIRSSCILCSCSGGL